MVLVKVKVVHEAGAVVVVETQSVDKLLEVLRDEAGFGRGSLLKEGDVRLAADASLPQPSPSDGMVTLKFKPAAGTAGGSGQAGVGLAADAFKVLFIVQIGKKSKETKERVFDEVPTLDNLVQAAEQEFPRFAGEEFYLQMGRVAVTSEAVWKTLASQKGSRGPVHIAVVSTCKSFSSFTYEDMKSLLGFKRDVLQADGLFKDCTTPDMAAGLPQCITDITGWKTVQEVLDHVGRDLAFRTVFSCPQDNVKEASARELISPVLLAGLACASSSTADFQLHAEFSVSGARARGNIDWVVLYENLSVVVVEAKVISKWRDYLGQLAAEIVGSREDFALNILGKRKAEAADVLKEVPSWGILTNGLSYKFYKYLEVDGEKELLGSKTMPLVLTPCMTASSARDAAAPIIAAIASILRELKACLDDHPEVKRLRHTVAQ